LFIGRFEDFSRKPGGIPVRDPNLGTLAESHGEEDEKKG